MSNMDPFDEFEFKPLTDGLGFHKKTVTLKEGLKSTGVLEDELQSVPHSMPKSLLDETARSSKKHSFDDVLSALEKTPLARSGATGTPELTFTEPLPRKEKKQAMELNINPVQSPFPQPGAYKSPLKIPTYNENKIGDFVDEEKPAVAANTVGTRRGAADSPQRNLFPAAVSFSSAILDGIIVFALSLVFLVALLMITKVDLSVVTKNLGKDLMTQVSLGVLFVAVMQMYAIISRSFFGRTLGEWTFDMQLGRDDEQGSEKYPLRVALRSLITTVTGLVLLPLISSVMGQDLAGRLSGVQLFRQRV
jgi:uncharacterized RDD family membrane protein YckC